MSLINDALRRAKQAQRQAAPDAHFRPVDPGTPSGRQGFGLLLPALLTAIALLGLLLFWELSRRGPSAADAQTLLTVAARTPASSSAPSDPVEAPTSVPEASAAVNTSALSKPTVESAQGAGTSTADSSLPDDAPVPARTNTAPTASARSETNHPTLTEPAIPPLKLQGIVFNPGRPSALINGRVIFVGDRVREYRVFAIRRDDVLLVGAGRTNLLSLDP